MSQVRWMADGLGDTFSSDAAVVSGDSSVVSLVSTNCADLTVEVKLLLEFRGTHSAYGDLYL